MSRALVIGKLWPPHAGHHACIRRAAQEATAVDVVICDDPRQRPSAGQRAEWVRAEHPDVTVHVVPDSCAPHWPDPCPPDCSLRWADELHQRGLGPWSVVVANEPYGPTFATALGARLVRSDPDRAERPVCGTEVRADLEAGWRWLAPATRRGLTRRVVVLGAESTGTTTLSRDLAGRLGCRWVPEMGRHLSDALATAAGGIEWVRWRDADFALVADGQERLEEAAVEAQAADPEHRPGPGGPVVVCDTDVLATVAWRRRYTGGHDPLLARRAASRPPLLYLLTSPLDVPFVQDGLRDGEHLREEMSGWFRVLLASQPVPWVELTGPAELRVETALAAVLRRAQDEPLFAP